MKLVFTLLTAAAVAQGQTLTTLANFDGTDRARPNSLLQGVDGNFYGTAASSSSAGETIFKLTPAGAVTTLHSFGLNGPSPLVQASDGNFYGTTPLGGATSSGSIFKITPSGMFTTLYDFGQMGGIFPGGGLVQAIDGSFYGTTSLGGASADIGTVFKFTPPGTVTTLHNFALSDGAEPNAGLIQATDGNFYGTTPIGGVGACRPRDPGPAGCGTIFKITPDGLLTTLYSFGVMSIETSSPPDGANPNGRLVQGSDGNFYGTTTAGGIGSCRSGVSTVIQTASGCGTVFKITPAGALTTLHTFDASHIDGALPAAGLIQATDGNFYGMTSAGGTGGCLDQLGTVSGCGTIFIITPQGSFTTLYSFGADYQTSNGISSDGVFPQGPLIQGGDGNLYGTAFLGGPLAHGTVFKFSLPPADTPAIAATGGVLNGASFQPGISSDSWMTINGTNLSSKTDTWNNSIVKGVLPTMLDGVSVMVAGQPAYIEYVSSAQINAVVPNMPRGSVSVIVTNTNGASPAAMVQLSAEQPAFFQWGNFAVATRQDFSLAVKNGTFPGTTTVAAKPGDVIILWGTGFGPTSPSAPAGVETPSNTTYNTATPVSVTVGGKSATVFGAALAPGYAGLYQVAIQIPSGLSNGDYPLIATVAGVQSPSTTMITVQP